MQSITKNRPPASVLRAMTEWAYGPQRVPAGDADWVRELGHGWFNVAYRIQLRDGENLVLKVAPPPALPEAEQARRRLYCLHQTLMMVIDSVYRGQGSPAQRD